ncbi:AAA family ATPase [Halobaculum rubrum]|uniref:AAA family ATPase n=1 Tax=Halobaculum rubrum TaxID=2872158 RepID=UPI001CA3F1A5|nr:AAA family ATPase [Halobaculum rubrum]QZY01204.1 AAA family ATPase [Halobaculum rubrum]
MSRLEILSLTIKDYRQYAGEVEIDLQTSGSKNINVIEGQNGAGKSNILNAITLCLYGKETHLSDKEDAGLESYPYVNRKRLSEINGNETATGYVELRLGKGTPEYIFKREFKTVKLPDGKYSSTLGELQLKQKLGRDWKTVDQPNTRLNQILPAHVHEYFLFDGERLDDFFGQGYQERVRRGLLDVSHIELLDRAITHLEKLEAETRREIDDDGGEAEQKRQEYEDALSKLESTRKELKNTKQNIEDTQNLRDKIDADLRDSSDPDVREKQVDRQNLTRALSQKQDEIEQLQERLSQELVQTGPAVYAHKSLTYTKEKLDELSEKGQLPPKIQDWFINELIETGTCICGEPITEESTEHLRSLKSEMSEVDEDNLEGKMIIPGLLDDAFEEVDEIKQIRQDLVEAEEEEKRLNRKLKEISEDLKSYDIPDDVDVQELENQREEYSNQLAKLREKKGRLESEIESAEELKNEKKKEYDEAASQKEENAELLKRIRFIETSRYRLVSVKEDILSTVRSEIEAKLNEYFNEIIWKEEEYTVKLGDDYQVRVEGPRNDNKIGSLSAGESQVLAFSFLAAITQISGFNAPIIIDTPLGRISSTPKKRIARNLPSYIDDSQITFLMTDEEYTDEVRANLKPSVSNEYRLEYANEVTKVVPYE